MLLKEFTDNVYEPLREAYNISYETGQDRYDRMYGHLTGVLLCLHRAGLTDTMLYDQVYTLRATLTHLHPTTLRDMCITACFTASELSLTIH